MKQHREKSKLGDDSETKFKVSFALEITCIALVESEQLEDCCLEASS